MLPEAVNFGALIIQSKDWVGGLISLGLSCLGKEGRPRFANLIPFLTSKSAVTMLLMENRLAETNGGQNSDFAEYAVVANDLVTTPAAKRPELVTLAILVLLAVVGCDGSAPDKNTRGDGEVGGATAALGRPSEDSVVSIRRAFLRRQYDQAKRLITKHLVAEPDDAEVLEIAGDLYAQIGDSLQATDFYDRVVKLTEKPEWKLLDKLGQQWMTAGRPFESLEVLEGAIAIYPNDAGIRQRLVGLQVSLGLEQRAAEHLQWLVQRQHGDLSFLIILSDLTRPQTVEATCRYALDQKTEDQRPHYSLARIPAYHGRWEDVLKELQPLRQADPGFVEGSALWGRALVELGRIEELEKWSSNLPEGIESCVDYWMALGSQAEKLGQLREAVGAFERVLLMNPSHPEALSRLGIVLGLQGQGERAKRVAGRAADVNRLRTHVDSLISWQNNSQQAVIEIARSLDRLGRLWEATAWLVAAYPMTQKLASELQPTFEEMRGRLTSKTPWQMSQQLAVIQEELSSIEGFDWVAGVGDLAVDNDAVSELAIHFTDEYKSRGLTHRCEIKPYAGSEAGLSIYQSGAGAVGVIDYDLDGWPDLYLTSMDGQPNQDNSSTNRIFRNGEGAFVDQTIESELTDRGFSQGVAVADYDADGFPDLLVASVGANHLYRNNGDGTFRDVTAEVGISGEQWTTSVAMADIDGDGNCDLFELGYCGGADVLSRQCIEKEINEPRSCSPLAFPAQGDRVWKSDGTGRLIDVTSQWLGEHEPGRGMGLVVGQLDQAQGLDLYVANDMTSNHLWLAQGDANRFTLSEQATLRGVALNQRSLAQASMGIAVGDPDQDADVDFFVTHFSGDHNTYYEQVDDGLWVDRSDASGLATPSQRLLAYGTQWIDADNDGQVELFVANGDIDDFTHQDRLFRQPFQVYARSASGRWHVAEATGLGAYFERPHLARSVVEVDFDRDFRADIVVTQLFEPVALLHNETSNTGDAVRINLRGIKSHRDAVGAVVSYKLTGDLRSKQLFAGDGYHCSSQRVLSIGTGNEQKLEDVSIRWPDGTVDHYGTLSSGAEYLLLQGAGEPYRYASVEL